MPIFRRIKDSDKIKDKKTRRLIKSSQRKYIDEKGKIYTRQEVEKIRGRKKRTGKYRTTKKGGVYDSLVKDYIKKKAREGVIIKNKDARQSQELKEIIKALKEGAALKSKGEAKNNPASVIRGSQKIIDALKKVGRRDGVPDFVIPGESPKLEGLR